MLLFITIDFGNICILLKFVLTKRDAVKYLSDKLLSNDEIYTFPCHLRDVSTLFVENNENRSKKTPSRDYAVSHCMKSKYYNTFHYRCYGNSITWTAEALRISLFNYLGVGQQVWFVAFEINYIAPRWFYSELLIPSCMYFITEINIKIVCFDLTSMYFYARSFLYAVSSNAESVMRLSTDIHIKYSVFQPDSVRSSVSRGHCSVKLVFCNRITYCKVSGRNHMWSNFKKPTNFKVGERIHFFFAVLECGWQNGHFGLKFYYIQKAH